MFAFALKNQQCRFTFIKTASFNFNSSLKAIIKFIQVCIHKQHVLKVVNIISDSLFAQVMIYY